MRSTRAWWWSAVFVLWANALGLPATAATTAQRCAAGKIKATGVAAERLLGCHATAMKRGTAVDQACLDRQTAKLASSFARAESRGGCVTSGDAAALDACATSFVGDVAAAVVGGADDDSRRCAAVKLKATGKTAGRTLTCHAKAASQGATVDPACVAKADAKFTQTFAGADAQYACAAEGDGGAVASTDVAPFVDAVVRALPWNADGTVALNGSLAGVQVFPTDNWWNRDVSTAPVAANSAAIIDFIGRATPLHPDFGTDFGIPYVVVDGVQPRVPVAFFYADESDAGAPGGPPGYPIPEAAKTSPGMIEGGVPGGGQQGDRHLLLVDHDNLQLFELYGTRWTGSGWTAGSGAFFDLTSNARRPEGWTSADAAGLAILPGLVRADEVFDAGEIRHALRFTVRGTKGYVFPASHDATSGPGGDARPPLGLRVRLKASVDVTGFAPPVQVILRAMQRYGMIIADNGSDWFVSGAPSPRWNDELMHDEFLRITGNDFDVVQ